MIVFWAIFGDFDIQDLSVLGDFYALYHFVSHT